MKEDYCTYEQAVKLKELGFDWKTTHYYDENGILTASFEEISADGGYEYIVSIDNLVGNFNLQNGQDDEWCSAPTMAQAAKWLRDIKGTIILVDVLRGKREIFYWKISDSSGFWIDSSVDNYNTYEEALLAGIDEVLEITKNK